MRDLARTCRWLLMVGLLLSISGIEAGAQAARNSSISGFVFDPGQRPLSQIYVELLNEFNSVIARMRTDGGGRFYFPGLGQGRFSIRVRPFGTGFQEQTAEVEITGTGMRGQAIGDNVQKDIHLRLSKTGSTTPFKNEVVFAQDIPKEAEASYKDAVSDLNSNRQQSGVAGLEKALAIFPNYFAALQRLGAARLTEEKFQEAAELFTKAVAINERSFDCWYGLAYADYALRRFKESAVSSEKAVFLKPESIEANLLLGMAQRINKDLPGAEKALKKAAKLAEGSSPDVHWQLALLYGKDLNRFADAAKELETYLELSPEAPNKEDIKKLIKQFKDKAKSSS